MNAVKILLLAPGLPALSIETARAQLYDFTTIAGLAGSDLSVDGTNSAARFNHPHGVAVDSGGNVYVAENDTIRMITPTGTNWVASTIAGLAGAQGSADGTNSTAGFWTPYGVAVDRGSNVYVADTLNCTIRKISPAGTNWVVSTIAGLARTPGGADGTNDTARFSEPVSIAVDVSSNLFVTDPANGNVRKMMQVGTNWVVSTVPSSTASYGVAVDTSGNVFLAETSGSSIRKLVQTGTNWENSTVAGMGQGSADGTNTDARFWQPYNLAVDSSGRLFVADTLNDTIRMIRPLGTN